MLRKRGESTCPAWVLRGLVRPDNVWFEGLWAVIDTVEVQVSNLVRQLTRESGDTFFSRMYFSISASVSDSLRGSAQARVS